MGRINWHLVNMQDFDKEVKWLAQNTEMSYNDAEQVTEMKILADQKRKGQTI